MYALFYAESCALALLLRDALKGRAKGISTQMIAGLTLSIMLAGFNLPQHKNRTLKICAIIAGSLLGTICSVAVSRTNEANGDDDLIIGRVRGRTSKLVPYVLTAVMGLLSLLAACHFSTAEMMLFMKSHTKAVACSFENYLHAFALLPQLVLCRRQGYVAPAAVKFLFLIGVKHIFEFTSDAYVSWQRYEKGRLDLHEFSFMSGDFLAAVILLDFFYLTVMSRFGVCLIFKDTELELDEDIEAPVSTDSKTMQEPSNMMPKSIQGKLAEFMEAFDAGSASLRKLLTCTLLFAASMIGTVFGLISIYPMIVAGLGFIVWRSIANPELPLPMHEKKEKGLV